MEASVYQPMALEQKRCMPVFAALIRATGLSGSSWHQTQPATAAVERSQAHMHTILSIFHPPYHIYHTYDCFFSGVGHVTHPGRNFHWGFWRQPRRWTATPRCRLPALGFAGCPSWTCGSLAWHWPQLRAHTHTVGDGRGQTNVRRQQGQISV